jgi:hypothetical protein
VTAALLVHFIDCRDVFAMNGESYRFRESSKRAKQK